MNAEHRKILFQGVAAWNVWRQQHPKIQPDLTGLDLTPETLVGGRIKTPILKFFHSGPPEEPSENFVVDLRGIDFRRTLLIDSMLGGVELGGADLREARLAGVDFTGAVLDGVRLDEADLHGAKLVGTSIQNATLCGASLHSADLWQTNLSHSDLTGASLIEARVLSTDFTGATLVGCETYGAALWDIELKDAIQSSIVVDPDSNITVDNLALAQIFHIIRKNQGLYEILDSLTRKVVLILGRFSEPYKSRLDAMAGALRQRGYSPSIYDVPGPRSRNMTETVAAMAHMSRFVVADISEPQSVQQELRHLATTLDSVPIVPVLLKGQKPWSMFDDLLDRPQVLDIVRYADTDDLLKRFDAEVIARAESKANEIQAARAARAARRAGDA